MTHNSQPTAPGDLSATFNLPVFFIAARNCRILTDDRDAREFARRLKIPLSGTLGVLVRLIDIGSLNLEEADVLLSQMIVAEYRSPVTSLQDLV